MVSTTGGERITVWGSGFDAYSLVVGFGDSVTAAAHAINGTVLYAVVPKQSARAMTIQISSNGYDWSSTNIMVHAVDPFYIHSVYPSSGSVAGNTHVTIHGGSFSSMASFHCMFSDRLVKAS
eukprot:3134121-Rhodomonas_salina.1